MGDEQVERRYNMKVRRGYGRVCGRNIYAKEKNKRREVIEET